MTISLKNFLRIHPNEKNVSYVGKCYVNESSFDRNTHLELPRTSYASYHFTTELVGDIFERGRGDKKHAR
jgi:hypothetical protein